MINLFFWFAYLITIIFFLLVIILFICHWVIYTRVERTILKTKRSSKPYYIDGEKEENDQWSKK